MIILTAGCGALARLMDIRDDSRAGTDRDERRIEACGKPSGEGRGVLVVLPGRRPVRET